MNPFDPNFKSDLFTPTKMDRGRRSMARKMSAKRTPTPIITPRACYTTPTDAEKLKRQKIEKGTL